QPESIASARESAAYGGPEPVLAYPERPAKIERPKVTPRGSQCRLELFDCIDRRARERRVKHLESNAKGNDAHARQFNNASLLPRRGKDAKGFPKIVGDGAEPDDHRWLLHRDWDSGDVILPFELQLAGLRTATRESDLVNFDRRRRLAHGHFDAA